MSTSEGAPTPAKKGHNHARNLAVIAAILAVGYLGWNAVAAVQCLSNDGEIVLRGAGVGCYLDFSRVGVVGSAADRA